MNTPVYGSALREAGAAFATLKVQASIIPDMYLRINEGSAFINRKLVEYAGGRIGPLVVPTVNTYIVVIALRGNTPVVLYGDIAANNPELPNIPTDALPLAAIALRASDTMISQDMVQDIRPLFAATTYLESHADLKDRDLADQHPIAAIAGLRAELDAKFDKADISGELDKKADYNGTRATTFTLNANSTGVPTSNIVLEFKRGAMNPAGIRFNEEEDRLEFTDNGDEWRPLNTELTFDPFNEENYYTKTAVDEKVTGLRRDINLKADAARVEALVGQINGLASQEDINNMFLNLYSKQDLDRLVADMKKGLLTITGKADASDVYTKTEVDEQHQAMQDKTDADLAALGEKIDAVTNQVKDEIEPQLLQITNDVAAQIDEARTEFNEATRTINDDVNTTVEQLTKKVDDSMSTVERRISDAAALSISMTSEKTGQLDAKFDAAIREANAKHDNIVETFNSMKDELNGSLQEVTTKVDSYDDVINTHTSDIASIKESLEANEANITSAQTSIRALNDSVNAINETNTTQDETIAALTDTVTANKTAAEDALNEAMTTINESINEKDTAINEKVDAVKAELDEKISTQETNYKAADVMLDSKIDELANTVSATEEALSDKISVVKVNAQDALNAAKEELTQAINEKADIIGAAYSAADQAILDNINIHFDSVESDIAIKADAETAVTKDELAEALTELDISDKTYTKDEVDNLLGSKAEIADVYKYTQAQIDNTLANKQEALGYTPEDIANKNIANGYAGLDANGKISLNQLPDSARQKTYVVANEAERLALTDLMEGDKAFETETSNSYIYNGVEWTLAAAANWENVNIDFINIVGKPTTLAGYGITDGVTATTLTTELENKAAKDHGHTADEITVSDERMFISAEKLAAIDNKANIADVYNITAADNKFETKDEFAATIADYSTTDQMNNAIDNAINNELVRYYKQDEVDNLLDTKVDATDTTVVRTSDLADAVNTAKAEIQEKLDAKANADDVYAKDTTYTQTETDTAIDSAIQGVLQTVNNSINEALGNASGDGSSAELTDIVTNTAKLIKDLSTDKDNKIQAVEEKIIKQVITKDTVVETVKETTNIDLSALTTANDVTAAINTALEPVNESINAKAANTDLTALSDTVTEVQSQLTAATATANKAASDLAEYIPVINGKTTIAEVNNKLADYTTTADLTELLAAKATPDDINEALKVYWLKSEIEEALGTKLTATDVATMLEAYLTNEAATAALEEKANKSVLINAAHDNVLYNKVPTTASGYTGSYTLIFNELNSGGGSQVYNTSDNTLSYVGTNLSSDGDKVQVQIYAKDNTTNIGTRLNVNSTLGMFYLKGTTNANPWAADREIAVLADIAALKTELEAKIQELNNIIETIDPEDINNRIQDIDSRLKVVEGV